MLILEIAAGVFLGGIGLWALGLLRKNKQGSDVEGQVGGLQQRTDLLESELRNIKSKVSEQQEAIEDLDSKDDEIDPDHVALLATRYYKGDGVPQDYGEAMKWCRLAATQGSAFARNMLGHMYEEGEGVEPDFQEAMKWYRLSAERGDRFGQNMLGLAYAKGQGVEQNYLEALRWHRLSAAQGHAAAMFNLGCMYRKGQGVKQDCIRARMWYILAANNGSGEAEYFLLDMNDEMTAEQIEEAETMAKSCMNNSYQDCNQENLV